MSIPINPPFKHHAQPAFYLSMWSGADGCLCEMSQPVAGKFQHRRKPPTATGYVHGLYSITGSPKNQAQIVETDFMGPLDNEAALAMQKLVGARPHARSGERWAWTRFILSLLIRSRESVEDLKRHSRVIQSGAIERLEVEYRDVRRAKDPPTLREHVSISAPQAADESAMRIFTESIDNQRNLDAIHNMAWHVRDLGEATVELLTSDRPVVMPWGIGDSRAFIALPLGPKSLFVAARQPTLNPLLREAATEVAKIMNRELVAQARSFVWGTDNRQFDFVVKYMSTLPDRVLLTDAQKAEAIAVARGEQSTR